MPVSILDISRPTDLKLLLTRLLATKADIETHFIKPFSGFPITEIKLMDGFGFIEYNNPTDARDAVLSMSIGPLFKET
jgi:RNA recognition motif-containing protein